MEAGAIDESRVSEILKAYPGDATSLILALQDIQREYNYLPRPALAMVSTALGVPIAKIHSVATFYKTFSLIPKGKNMLRVCTGTACHIRGANLLVDEVERKLKIKPGETTEDLNYSLETVNCVGACAMAPVLILNKTYHSKARAAYIEKILKEAEGGETGAD